MKMVTIDLLAMETIVDNMDTSTALLGAISDALEDRALERVLSLLQDEVANLHRWYDAATVSVDLGIEVDQ